MYYFTGADDIRRQGNLKWKSDDGPKSLELQCSNDYEDGGYSRQCLVTGIIANMRLVGKHRFYKNRFSINKHRFKTRRIFFWM